MEANHSWSPRITTRDARDIFASDRSRRAPTAARRCRATTAISIPTTGGSTSIGVKIFAHELVGMVVAMWEIRASGRADVSAILLASLGPPRAGRCRFVCFAYIVCLQLVARCTIVFPPHEDGCHPPQRLQSEEDSMWRKPSEGKPSSESYNQPVSSSAASQEYVPDRLRRHPSRRRPLRRVRRPNPRPPRSASSASKITCGTEN